MAFKFRLEQILKYRSGLEEQAQEALGRRNRQAEKTARKLELLHEERESTHGYWRKETEKEVNIARLNCVYHYLNHLGEKIDSGIVEKNKSFKQVDEQRHVLKKCWQDRRIMELLQDKKLEEYSKWEDKQECNLSDELSLATFVRNRNLENNC